MSKRKIMLDLSGGWYETLEDAININNSIFIYAPFGDPSRVLRRNDRIYTKHHLKFGKNQADNLAYIGFRRRFFPVFYWCLVL